MYPISCESNNGKYKNCYFEKCAVLLISIILTGSARQSTQMFMSSLLFASFIKAFRLQINPKHHFFHLGTLSVTYLYKFYASFIFRYVHFLMICLMTELENFEE